MPAAAFGDIDVFVHGTTLATNAIIERRGARTALIATEGFRDVLDIANESRYDQYDLTIEKPQPLVPRALRFTVPERMDVHGEVRLPLDEGAVRALARRTRGRRHREPSPSPSCIPTPIPAHERRTREILKAELPELWRDAVERGLPRDARIRAHLDGGGQRLCAAADGRLSRAHGRRRSSAEQFRGHDLSGDLGRRPHRDRDGAALPGAPRRIGPGRRRDLCGADRGPRAARRRVLSFDMGGTTAKICLIDDYKPQTARAVRGRSRGALPQGLAACRCASR